MSTRQLLHPNNNYSFPTLTNTMMFAADNNCRAQRSDWSNNFDHHAANNLGNFGFNFNFNPVDSNVGYQFGQQTQFFSAPFCFPNANPPMRFVCGAADGGGRWAKRPRVQEPDRRSVNHLGNFNRVASNLCNQSYESESIVYQVGQKRKFISGPSLCPSAADGGAWAEKPRVQEFGRGKDKVNQMIKTIADLGVSVNDNLVDSNFCDIVRDLIVDHLSQNRKVVSNNKRVKMACGSIYLPKDNPARPRGDDAHFTCVAEQTIGVADGVGGWALKGIDAGEYARELMSNASEAVRNIYNDNKNQPIDPTKVLKEAYENTKKNSLGLQGSSTACILSLNKETGVLRAANVGDSGFMLFRDNKMVYKSPIMQKRFNCPYQLGNCAAKSDPVECAEEIVVPLAAVPGDVIVLGTDGLLDNLFPSEIEECLSSFANGRDENEVAGYIANLALYNSGDKRTDSPFSVEARKAGIEHKGGKIDDITVIVARVCGCV